MCSLKKFHEVWTNFSTVLSLEKLHQRLDLMQLNFQGYCYKRGLLGSPRFALRLGQHFQPFLDNVRRFSQNRLPYYTVEINIGSNRIGNRKGPSFSSLKKT